jgi:hypothetical protein
MKLLVVGDSHAKRMHNTRTTSMFAMTIVSIPGVQWINTCDKSLSLLHLLFSSELQWLSSETESLVFWIGTNSIRIFPASKIIKQIEEIIFLLHCSYRHLSQPRKISIFNPFPCLKTTRRFPTKSCLISNIQLYNRLLCQSATHTTFNAINFPVLEHHLANDRMHLRRHVYRRLFRFLTSYFNQSNHH